MSLSKFRSLLYRLGSILGDVQAVRKGDILGRIVRKQTTKMTFSGLRSLWRFLK